MPIQQTRRAFAPGQRQDERSGLSAQIPRQQPRQYRRIGASSDGIKQLATALGWFSIGLGLAEVLAPRGLARLIGLGDDHPVLFRLLGLREIASGVGILTARRPAGWLWSRVAGDAMDLSLLGAALASDDSDRGRVAAATAAVAGVTSLDLLCAQKLSRDSGRAVRVETITINRPPEEVYGFWRDFQNLPRFMSHLESVRVIDGKRSHWVARAPAGMTVEWDAEIIEDAPNEVIAWRSLEGSGVPNAGSVRFSPAPGGRGTELRVQIEYEPPAGAIGAQIAKLTGEEPGQQLKGDLYRFKQVMETGEVVHSDSSIHSLMHPARPPAS
ncbi:MAG TPA: SRPBCC family protein [Blastocatellia bacterium]|nr:SRPBCC family protein [Blastocatellia bacterium]